MRELLEMLKDTPSRSVVEELLRDIVDGIIEVHNTDPAWSAFDLINDLRSVLVCSVPSQHTSQSSQ